MLPGLRDASSGSAGFHRQHAARSEAYCGTDGRTAASDTATSPLSTASISAAVPSWSTVLARSPASTLTPKRSAVAARVRSFSALKMRLAQAEADIAWLRSPIALVPPPEPTARHCRPTSFGRRQAAQKESRARIPDRAGRPCRSILPRSTGSARSPGLPRLDRPP